MKINFKYSGEITPDILTKLELPLHMAKKFLEKIPHSLSNKTEKRAEFEMMAEGFLLFMIVSRDRLLQEINQVLPSGDRLCKRKVELDTLLKKLKNSHDQNFQKIGIMIEETTQEPKKNINSQGEDLGWKQEKTWLWEINELRNQVGHRNISNQAVYPGSDSSNQNMIIWVKDNQKIEVKDPRDYFDQRIIDFEELVKNIRPLL